MTFYQTLRMLIAILIGNEYAHFRIRRELLRQLFTSLAGTRFGCRLQKQIEDNQDRQETQQRIAQIMRQHVPKKTRVLIVDKWDPTLFHLSRRQGWNFPECSLLPEGYPANDEKAIHHLDQLLKLGANYLVFPNAAFWWLDYYQAFRRHLEENHACLWNDQQCLIYQLRKKAL